MTANIYWERVKPATKTLAVGSPSEFIESMRKVFGWPCTLDQTHIKQLEAMAAMYAYSPNPFQNVIDLLEEKDIIRLWAEY